MSAERLREAATEIRLEWAGDRGGAWSRTQDSATLVAKDDIGYARTVADAYLGSTP